MTYKVLLVGSGKMAEEYSKVLLNLGSSITVVGRSDISAKKFSHNTGLPVIQGGLEHYLSKSPELFANAIVAVGVEELADTCQALMKYGVKRILLEKPGGLTIEEINKTVNLAKENQAKVFIAYNRRFYQSTKKCEEIISQDGGVKSFHFEFTEWGHEIINLKQSELIKNSWFIANSTHVVDLAFYLGGYPINMENYTSGYLTWHPSSSIFVGSGITNSKALFSYHANWNAPGRWGLEILTSKRRLIFSPLEELKIMNIGSTIIKTLLLDQKIDTTFKPGLYEMVKKFLINNSDGLCTLEQHQKNWVIYSKIAGYDK